MSASKCRLAVMASSEVGSCVITYLIREYPDDLVAVVVDSEAYWAELANSVDMPLPVGCEVLAWKQVRSDPAILERLHLDILLLAWWPHVLRPDTIATAKHVLNMHPSLLPFGRGKDPNFWALKNQTPYGVTIHHVDSGVDTGDIAFQQEIFYDASDTGGSLYARANRAIVELFVRSYAEMRVGRIPRLKQVSSAAPTRRRAELDPASTLDLNMSMTVREILNLLRARTFSPHPGCRFEEGGVVFDVTVTISAVGRKGIS